MMKPFFTLIAASFFILQTLPSSAQKNDKDSNFALFASDEIIEASIYFDLGVYLRKNLKGDGLDGRIIFNRGSSDSLVKDIRIKTRGVFRQQYCGFPPMEINFKKPVSAYGDEGSGFKKLKVVTHCEQGKGSDDYILREFLVYKLFNALTDTSYRVRLLRMNYIDNARGRKPIVQYAFCIEPAEILTKRINCIRLKNAALTQKQVLPGIITRIAIFNYMIGNYDWAVPNQQNLHILKSLDIKKSQLAVAVPYDFDFTGFVNPYYAIPTDETGLKSIRERLFTGMCRTRDDFRSEILKIAAQKEAFYRIINEFPYLNVKSKKDLTGYLDQFFDETESKTDLERLIDTFMMTCKKL